MFLLYELPHTRIIEMNLEEFENSYRRSLEESLIQLQTALLLLAQLQTILVNHGHVLQNLSRTVEEFINQQKTE